MTKHPQADKLKEPIVNKYYWYSEGREHPVVVKERFEKGTGSVDPLGTRATSHKDLTHRYHWFSEQMVDKSIYFQPGPQEGLIASRRAPMDGVNIIMDH